MKKDESTEAELETLTEEEIRQVAGGHGHKRGAGSGRSSN
jgi:hypothetical protein